MDKYCRLIIRKYDYRYEKREKNKKKLIDLTQSQTENLDKYFLKEPLTLGILLIILLLNFFIVSKYDTHTHTVLLC